MSVYIPTALRQLVVDRAKNRCEYCLFHERHSFLSFHIEHIISLKHGGTTSADNLAYACPICNANKGTDLGTIIPGEDGIIRFFNPRTDVWEEHFEMDRSTGEVLFLTPTGAATIKILDLNHPDAIIERLAMIQKRLI